MELCTAPTHLVVPLAFPWLLRGVRVTPLETALSCFILQQITSDCLLRARAAHVPRLEPPPPDHVHMYSHIR